MVLNKLETSGRVMTYADFSLSKQLPRPRQNPHTNPLWPQLPQSPKQPPRVKEQDWYNRRDMPRMPADGKTQKNR